ncbi:virB8 family protein [Ochrobactrum soli]|uniref:Type IV secretion system protein virB8 n=1 Tax=Ochrobactrum soli TaxID=2448455 RepID=A0A849KU48_9HYPH|nr:MULTISPECIES: VirB8/TrbF family protein [Brucella]NNU63377.1 virB8 family protein [[Ochrobactrum] soli]
MSGIVQKDDLKEYFERSRRWEQDELRSALRSKRLAWTVAAIASIGMIVSVGAVAALAPLKSVEPFLVRVDNTNGIVDTVASLKDAPVTLDDAMSRYFVAKYVRSRESYSPDTAKFNYDVVSNMSTGPVQETYANWVSGNNPNSPQRVYGSQTKVSVDITSVQLVRPGLASVRYRQTIEYEQNRTTKHFIATVVYQLLPDADLSIQQRLINPVAFAVTEYRTDPEVVE